MTDDHTGDESSPRRFCETAGLQAGHSRERGSRLRSQPSAPQQGRRFVFDNPRRLKESRHSRKEAL
jgi:hypothetical protein